MRRLAKDPNKPTVKSKGSAVNIAKKYRNMGLNARVIPNQRGFNVYVGNPRLYYARRGFIDGRGPEPKVGLSTLGTAYRGNKTPPLMNFNGYPIQYSNSKNIPQRLRGKEALIHDLSFGGVMGQQPMPKNASTQKKFFDIRQLDDGDVLISEPVIVFDDEQKTWIIKTLGEKAKMFIDPEYSPPTVSFTGKVKFDRNMTRREKNQFTKTITSGQVNLQAEGIEGWLEERLKSYVDYDYKESLENNANRMLGSKNWDKIKITINDNSQQSQFLETMLQIAQGKRKADGFTGTKPISQNEIGLPFVGYVPEWKLLGPAVEEVDEWIMTLDGYDPNLNLFNNIKAIGGESATEAIQSLFEESKRFREDMPTGPGEGNQTYNRKKRLAKNRDEITDEMWDKKEMVEQEFMEMIEWNNGFIGMSETEREEILDDMYDEISREGLSDIDKPIIERFGINDEYVDGKYKSELVKDLQNALTLAPGDFDAINFKVRQSAGSFNQFSFMNNKGEGLYSPLNEDMVQMLLDGKGGIDGSELLGYVEQGYDPDVPLWKPKEIFYETNSQYLNWMNEIGKALNKNRNLQNKQESDLINLEDSKKLSKLFYQLKGAIEFYDTRDLDSSIINELVVENLRDNDLLDSINWKYVLSIRDTQDPFSQLNPALEPERSIRRKRADNRIVNLDDMIQNNDDIDGEDRFNETIDYANKLTELLDSDVEWIARGEQRNVFRPIKGEEGQIGKGNVLKINRHLFIGDNQKNHPSVKGIRSDVLTAQDTGFWEDYTTKRIKALGSNDWGDYSDLIVPAKTAGPGAVIQKDVQEESMEAFRRYAESGNWGSEIEMWREKAEPDLTNWASEQDFGEANFAFFSDDYVYRLLDFYSLGLPNEYRKNEGVTPADAGFNSRFRTALKGGSQEAIDEQLIKLDENRYLRAQNKVENANEYVLDEIDRMLVSKGIDPVDFDGVTVEKRGE